MFVIMQSLYNLGDQFNGNVVDTLSAALERSGVAITVTSLTDVLAFGVGATTVSIINNYFRFQKILFWKEERIPSDLFTTSYNKAILFRSAFNLEICYQMILKERQHHFIFHSQKYLQ